MTGDAAGDATRLVARSYDAIAEPYLLLGERTAWGSRPEYLQVLLDRLPPGGARVLDLGCGGGLPVAAALVAAGHRVVAVDVSPAQARLAREHAPGAAVVVADMAHVAFLPAAFDAVALFYSLTHVPRRRHLDVLARVHTWLRPGGLLVATMGAGDNPDGVAEDFLGLGSPMFFSHYDAATNRALVERAGLEVERADLRTQVEDGRSVRFSWVVARRP